ncbi:MAG: alpha/beta hydrolase [Hyphomicrobiaceae bacterium]
MSPLHLLAVAGTSLFVYLAIALALVFWPTAPVANAGSTASAELGRFIDAGTSIAPSPALRFEARDGSQRLYRLYGAGDDLLIFLHGSGADSRYLSTFATRLSAAAGLRIATLDMRGHGPEPVRRGDVDTVDQQEHDIADLAAILLRSAPKGRFLLGGHSMGGGLSIRYAAGAQVPRPAGLLLIAPFVHRKSPSARPGSGGWAAPRMLRFAGIEMLGRLGLRPYDHLPVIEFAIPPSAQDGNETRHYSWRLFTSVTPRDAWQTEIARLPARTLVVAAGKDVIFRSEGYQAAFATRPGAEVEVLSDLGHFDLIRSDATISAAVAWLRRPN